MAPQRGLTSSWLPGIGTGTETKATMSIKTQQELRVNEVITKNSLSR